MTLRRVEDLAPLDKEGLIALGSTVAGRAQRAAVDAVRVSMHTEFMERRETLFIADIERWRMRAQTARKAWQEVESLTTELIEAFERAARAKRDER